MASYCWNASHCSLNTSISPPPPHFNLQHQDSYSVALQATLKLLLMRKHIIVLNQIIPLLSFHLNPYYVSAAASHSFCKCLSVCLSVSQSVLSMLLWEKISWPVRLWELLLTLYPSAATRWGMITAESLSLWDASSSAGCCWSRERRGNCLQSWPEITISFSLFFLFIYCLCPCLDSTAARQFAVLPRSEKVEALGLRWVGFACSPSVFFSSGVPKLRSSSGLWPSSKMGHRQRSDVSPEGLNVDAAPESIRSFPFTLGNVKFSLALTSHFAVLKDSKLSKFNERTPKDFSHIEIFASADLKVSYYSNFVPICYQQKNKYKDKNHIYIQNSSIIQETFHSGVFLLDGWNFTFIV